jgi:hypothetical protein
MTINKSLILFLSNFRFKPNMNYAEQESQEKVYPQEKVSPQEETIKTQQEKVVIHPQQNVEAGDQQKEETPLIVQNQEEEATQLDESKFVEVVVAVVPDEVEVPITNNGIFCRCLPADYDQLSQDSALTEVSDCGSNDSGYDSSDFDFDSQDSWF